MVSQCTNRNNFGLSLGKHSPDLPFNITRQTENGKRCCLLVISGAYKWIVLQSSIIPSFPSIMLLVALILQSLPAHSCFFLLEDDNSTRGENRSSKISLLSRIVPILKKNENFNFPGLLAVGGGGAPLSAEIWIPDERFGPGIDTQQTHLKAPPCALIGELTKMQKLKFSRLIKDVFEI